MRGASCKKKYGKSLAFLLLGKPGIGKSTLVNGLVGKNVAEVSARGDISTEGVTKELKHYEVIIEDVTIQVWDTPGLLDPNIGTKRTLNAVKDILDEIDMFLFCVDMTTTRVFEEGDESAMVLMISEILGEKFWDKAIIALVKANLKIHQLTDELDTPEQVKTAYKNNLKKWKRLLGEMTPVRKVKVIPVGISRKPLLFPGDKSPWLSKFWRKAYNKLSDEKQLALSAITLDRLLVYSDSHMKLIGETCRNPIKTLTKLVNLKKSIVVGDISTDEDEPKAVVEKLRSEIDNLAALQGDFSIDEDRVSFNTSPDASSEIEQVAIPVDRVSFDTSPDVPSEIEQVAIPVDRVSFDTSPDVPGETEQVAMLKQTSFENDSDILNSKEPEAKHKSPTVDTIDEESEHGISNQSKQDADEIVSTDVSDHKLGKIPSESEQDPPIRQDLSEHMDQEISEMEPVTPPMKKGENIESSNEILPVASAKEDKKPVQSPTADNCQTMPILETASETGDKNVAMAVHDVASPLQTLSPTGSQLPISSPSRGDITTCNSQNEMLKNRSPEVTMDTSRVRSSTDTECARSSSLIENSPLTLRENEKVAPRFRSRTATEVLVSFSEPSKKNREESQRQETSGSSSTDQSGRKIGRFKKDRFSFLNPQKPLDDDDSKKNCPPPKRRLVSSFKPTSKAEPMPPQMKPITPGKMDRARLDLSTYKSPFKNQDEDEHPTMKKSLSALLEPSINPSTKPTEIIDTPPNDEVLPPIESLQPPKMSKAPTTSEPLATGKSTPADQEPPVTLEEKTGKSLETPRTHQELPSPVQHTMTTDETKQDWEKSYVIVADSFKTSMKEAKETSLSKKDATSSVLEPTNRDVSKSKEPQTIQEIKEDGRLPDTSTMAKPTTEISGTRNPEDQNIYVSEGFFGKMKKTLQRIFKKFF